jgi:hypothetical protein
MLVIVSLATPPEPKEMLETYVESGGPQPEQVSA